MSENVARFFAAWGVLDAKTRESAIRAAINKGFTYSDPRSGQKLSESDKIIAYISQFSANAPGWQAEVISCDDVNGYIRAIVSFHGQGPDGKEIRQLGTYFGECDEEGQLSYLAGFIGTGDAPSA